MEEIIKGLLGTIYKIPETEIAELLKKSDGTEGIDEKKVLNFIIDKDKARITAIKAEIPTKFDEAFKKATKEVWTKVEKSLKEKFDIESDLQGDDLIEFVSETAKEKAKDAPGEKKDLTDDDIKKLPVYTNAEKAWKKQLAEKETEKVNALKELQDKFSQEKTFSKVRDAALSKFKKLGDVILPADPEKADKMIQRLLIDELTGYTYQVDDKGNFLLLDKDGKRVEDEHGHAMEFENLIEKIAKSNFDFKVSKDRKSPANGGDDEGDDGKSGGGDDKKKKYTGKAPADKQEYLGLLTSDTLTSEQKLEVKSQYGGQFSNN